MDDASSHNSNPDVMSITLDIDNKTWRSGNNLGITYNDDNTTLYTFDSFEETCKVLSSDEKLIAMSYQWMHDGGDGLKTNYRLFTQDQALASKLLKP